LRINENRNSTPAKILDGVRGSVNSFVGSASQFDDLTMLWLEYKAGDKLIKNRRDFDEENNQCSIDYRNGGRSVHGRSFYGFG
jgi:hypothetical protein